MANPKQETLVTKSNRFLERLRELRDREMLSWREIARHPEMRFMPQRTLYMVYMGRRDVPKKYKEEAGIQEEKLVPAYLEVYDPTTHHPTKNRTRKSRTPRHQPGKVWVF